MSKDSEEKSAFRIIFEKILIPAIAIAIGWIVIFHEPYILLIIIVVFIILVLISGVNFRKKK